MAFCPSPWWLDLVYRWFITVCGLCYRRVVWTGSCTVSWPRWWLSAPPPWWLDLVYRWFITVCGLSGLSLCVVSLLQEGGLNGFMHCFLAEVMAICRAHVSALGGNALVAFQLTECIIEDNVHKNQVIIGVLFNIVARSHVFSGLPFAGKFAQASVCQKLLSPVPYGGFERYRDLSACLSVCPSLGAQLP